MFEDYRQTLYVPHDVNFSEEPSTTPRSASEASLDLRVKTKEHLLRRHSHSEVGQFLERHAEVIGKRPFLYSVSKEEERQLSDERIQFSWCAKKKQTFRLGQ